MVSITRILAMAAVLSLAACSKQPSPPVTDGVTDALLASVPEGEWLNYGNDLGEQHYSNLELIDDSNVGELGLAWFADFETARGRKRFR